MTNPRSRGFPRAFFVDTSAFFAANTRDDERHERALQVLRLAVEFRARMVTTTYVLAESHALHLNKLGWASAAAFLRDADNNPAFAVVQPTLDDELRARAIIYRYTDKTFSLTDAISFAVMERLRLREAFTFDRDFEQYGFAALG